MFGDVPFMLILRYPAPHAFALSCDFGFTSCEGRKEPVHTVSCSQEVFLLPDAELDGTGPSNLTFAGLCKTLVRPARGGSGGGQWPGQPPPVFVVFFGVSGPAADDECQPPP